MSVCTTCRVEDRVLVRIDSWGVPHGTSGHQINHRWTSLSACPQCETGRLVRFDHDCFHMPWEEPWDMAWSWWVAVDGVRRLKAALASCPDALRPSCECPVHRSLRDSTDSSPSPEVQVTVMVTADGLPQVRQAPVP
ncbi:hypothetical protein AB0B85_27845 [Micromonospora sp. NPDC049044]|uniref:hypothetical protein n=1 Tax=unclassified Micromonospora TaxID=2617518 RepID=UPI0033E8C8B8